MKGPVRFRNDERSVHCDEAIEYILPEGADGLPVQLPAYEPRVEQWNAPVATPLAAAAPAAVIPAVVAPTISIPAAAAPATVESSPEDRSSSLKPSPAPNGPSPINAAQAYVVPPPIGAPSPSSASSMPVQPGRRKLLINMTETDRPDEDQMLLREVLQTLLDFPGTDAVDLLITSEGRNWRLEMPIITTGFCPALESRVYDLLQRPDAITVAGADAVAVG